VLSPPLLIVALTASLIAGLSALFGP